MILTRSCVPSAAPQYGGRDHLWNGNLYGTSSRRIRSSFTRFAHIEAGEVQAPDIDSDGDVDLIIWTGAGVEVLVNTFAQEAVRAAAAAAIIALDFRRAR